MSRGHDPTQQIASPGTASRWHRLGGRAWRIGAALVLLLIGSLAYGQQFEVKSAPPDNSTGENDRRVGETGPAILRDPVGANTTPLVDTSVRAGAIPCYPIDAFNSAQRDEACGLPTATVLPDATAAATSDCDGTDGGCFLSTAAFGSPSAREARILREVRERYLEPYPLGQSVLHVYDDVSPFVAHAIQRSDTLRAVVRVTLMPLVGLAVVALWSPILGLSVAIAPLFIGIWLFDRRPWRH